MFATTRTMYRSAGWAIALSLAASMATQAATTPTLALSASPTTIARGAATRVSWSSTSTTSCVASGAWSGTLGVSGSRNVVLYNSGTLYLTCKGSGGQVQKNVAITVAATPPPSSLPVVTLSASPTSVAAGGTTSLTWSSTNATSCTASGEWSGTRPTSGSESSAPLSNSTSTFRLTCTGAGGQTSRTVNVAVAAGTPPSGAYSTNFDLTENPASEGGAWRRAANNFTNVRSSGGLAFGTNGVTDTYDDSYALLSGFAPNQSIEGVVQRSSSLNANVTHEVEMLLRFSDSTSGARGYECLFAFYGGVQIVRWNGTQGNYTVLQSTAGPGNLGRGLATGDVVKATISGNLISLYINGVLMARATDSAFTTGQPGIGFFTRPGGNSAHLALTRITAASQ
jgi:hypothetical protein